MTKLNSKIYLIGEREPIFSSEATAKSIRDAFDNNMIPGNRVLGVGSVSFHKDQIKRIFVEKDGDHNLEKRAPYFVIYHPTRKVIWKQPYTTRQEAQAELDFQTINLKPGQTCEWVVEER